MSDPISGRLLDALQAALGSSGLLTEPDDVAPYLVDWRGAHGGAAPAILRPSNTAEVAVAMKLCHGERVAVVPQGGNTGLCGGAVPDGSGNQLVLSLGRLRTIRGIDLVDDAITVEAGVVLHDVQEAAAAAGRLFPLSLGSEGSCTVGGNLATNAGGTGVLRYGMMRDLTLGLEVVLPDGRVWDGLRALRKDNTGYNLTQLFVGSEGTLGVITAAVLKLFPATPRRATAWIALPDAAAALGVLGLLRERAGTPLSAYELMSRQALDMVLAHLPTARDPFADAHAWYGLIELAAPESDAMLEESLEGVLGEAFERGFVTDAVLAGSPAQRQSLWALREGISEAQNHQGPSLKHDVAVPIRALPDFLHATSSAIELVVPGIRLVTYGHVGDGNLHHNLSKPVGASDSEFLVHADELTRTLYDHVAAAGGSISAEHGLGTAKRDAAAKYKPAVELDIMRVVKAGLDPLGLMNPGKVL